MQIVTVGPKHQVVIPKQIRKKIKGFAPGSKVVVQQLNDQTITIKTETQNWLDRTRGMMSEAWKGINTTKYLEELRDEWDRKN